MKNPKLLKIVAAITLLVILAGLIYSKTGGKVQNPAVQKQETNQQTTENNNQPQTIEDKQSQEEGKRFLESFLVTYNSYRLGDASNVESLYPSMSADMLANEKEKVKKLKDDYGNYKGYITVQSEMKDSQIESADANAITLKVVLEESTIDGAFVPDPDSDKPDAMILVDRIGSRYSGNVSDLVSKKTLETFRIVGVKESDDWKVKEVQKISQ